MSRRFCPECGHENPAEARFCMGCGFSLTNEERSLAEEGRLPPMTAAPPAPAQSEGADWAGIVAAVLAFLSLRHMSRKARGTAIVITILVLFFGCPMVCGFVMFAMDWFAQLIR